MRRLIYGFIAITLGLGAALAQEPLKSGPQKDAVLPSPFDAFNINGKTAADRQHCLICQNALNPAVLVFARDPVKAKDAKSLGELLEKLDEIVERYEEAFLGAFAVFLSPDARSSVTDAAQTDIDELLQEAEKRIKMFARLKTQAEPLKNVVVAAYPQEGPKGYKVDPKAEVTVIFYQKLKVAGNWAFREGEMTEDRVAAIMNQVEEALQAARTKKK